jgi:hypothetical protein
LEDKDGLSNLLNSLTFVTMMGLSIIMLGTLRIYGVEISPVMILGVSLFSFFYVTLEFIEFATKFNIHPLARVLLILFSVASIIILPSVLSPKNISTKTLSLLADSTSLIALGVSILLLGFRGSYELRNHFKQQMIKDQSMVEKVNEVQNIAFNVSTKLVEIEEKIKIVDVLVVEAKEENK